MVKIIQDHYKVSGYSYECASYLGRKQQDFIYYLKRKSQMQCAKGRQTGRQAIGGYCIDVEKRVGGAWYLVVGKGVKRVSNCQIQVIF